MNTDTAISQERRLRGKSVHLVLLGLLAGIAPLAAQAVPRDSIASALRQMAIEDQAIRADFGARVAAGDTAYLQRLMASDSARTRQLRALVTRHGWPTPARVSRQAADDAWLLLQHADDVPFQLEVLAQLWPLARAGEFPAGPVAMLEDRTRLKQGRPQWYGSGFTVQDGVLIAEPLEEPGTVDARRAEVGLPPMSVYVDTMRIAYGLAAIWPDSVERPAPDSAIRGSLRIHTLASRTFGNTRKLRVLVPPGYDDPANAHRTWPVLYLHDGQNLFDPRTSFVGEWRVDEVVDSLVRAGTIAPIIVVGIDNAGRDRIREYLPYPEPRIPAEAGTLIGDRHPAFLVDEVLPYIEGRYRVAREAVGRGLGGSSLGALISVYTAAMRPGIFGTLLLESSALGWGSRRIFEDAAAARWAGTRAWIATGSRELGDSRCEPSMPEDASAADSRALAAALLAHGAAGDAIALQVEPCAPHNEKAWAARLGAALGFLYGQVP